MAIVAAPRLMREPPGRQNDRHRARSRALKRWRSLQPDRVFAARMLPADDRARASAAALAARPRADTRMLRARRPIVQAARERGRHFARAAIPRALRETRCSG